MNEGERAPRTFRARVAYDGARFSGWQLQHGQTSVQGALEHALHTIVGAPVRVTGAGRTDAGVHALGQVASFEAATRLDPERLRAALNFHLPPDVRVQRLGVAEPGFSARFSARWRLYWYRLTREVDPFLHGRALLPRAWPDLDRMSAAAAFLLGEWDFRSFTTQGEGPYGCYVTEARWEETRGGARFVIRANRFLYHMVRIIVGTLLDVGRGSREPEEVGRILLARTRSAAGPLAPAAGLYLVQVGYDPEWPDLPEMEAPPWATTSGIWSGPPAADQGER